MSAASRTGAGLAAGLAEREDLAGLAALGGSGISMLCSSEWSSSIGGAPAVLSRMAESSSKIEEPWFALYRTWLPLRSATSSPASASWRNSRCSEPAGTPVRREIMRTWKRSPGRSSSSDSTRWR